MTNFNNFIGQQHLIGENGPLYQMIKNDTNHSFVLYGSPGTGKTSLANLFIRAKECSFHSINGSTTSLAELKESVKNITFNSTYYLIIDEIHRLDKAKQNYLLPFLEDGSVYIIGTTTDNPYYSLNPALRSRLLLFDFRPISREEFIEGIKNYQTENYDYIYNDDIYDIIEIITKQDIRMSFNIINFLVKNYTIEKVNINLIKTTFNKNQNFADTKDHHYNLLSCFQKSIRASDVNASVYYLASLLAFNDLEAVFRRISVIAYEDIGLANPQLCSRVENAILASQRIGLPECRIILSNIVIELALSPKSNSAYLAVDSAANTLALQKNVVIPTHLLGNSPLKTDYTPLASQKMNNLPNDIKNEVFYTPQLTSNYETKLEQQLQFYKERRDKK